MSLVFSQIDVVCSDMEATLGFYRSLGVDIPPAAVWEHGGRPHHVEVAMPGGATLAVNSSDLTRAYHPAWPKGAAAPILVFSVPHRATVDELYARLTASGTPGPMPPTDAFWGARYAIVGDPDGNHVGIMSPSDAEHGPVPGFE